MLEIIKKIEPRYGAIKCYDINKDYDNEWFNQGNGNNTPLKGIKTEMVKTESGKRIAEYSCITYQF